MNLKDRVRTASKERKAQAAAKAKAETQKIDKTKTGGHDNTAISMDGDTDEEANMPPPPKKLSLRQRITEVYEKRVAETKAQRPVDATQVTPSAQLKIEAYTEHVAGPVEPLEKPVTLDDAPTVTLRDLLADEDKSGDSNLDEELKLSRLEFILVERSEIPVAGVAPLPPLLQITSGKYPLRIHSRKLSDRP